jgi:predicted GNAT superfamily acetyltransferase
MSSESNNRAITIRQLTSFDDFIQVETAEKEIWTLADIGVLPVTLSIAAKAAGCIWLGAFDGEHLTGFAFGMLGLENGELNIHSHMLGVMPAYRGLDIGYKLKLAQREQAMALRIGDTRGGTFQIREMTWTFDPLHARNAHLNFSKLGVVCDRYEPDFYGPATSSALHQNSTDRLWVRWLLDSQRVRNRIEGKLILGNVADVASLVRFEDGKPRRSDFVTVAGENQLIIEIPGDILGIEQRDPQLAREWRQATRSAFTEALAGGFFVAEFFRSDASSRSHGAYLLEKNSLQDYVL